MASRPGKSVDSREASRLVIMIGFEKEACSWPRSHQEEQPTTDSDRRQVLQVGQGQDAGSIRQGFRSGKPHLEYGAGRIRGGALADLLCLAGKEVREIAHVQVVALDDAARKQRRAGPVRFKPVEARLALHAQM